MSLLKIHYSGLYKSTDNVQTENILFVLFYARKAKNTSKILFATFNFLADVHKFTWQRTAYTGVNGRISKKGITVFK